MSLLLPYFKMDVIDWLKSEKIEQMSTTCIGSYILLLCEAWTRPFCSLPSARLALMKLGRFPGTEDEFEPLMQCFEPLKGDRSRVINPRLKREWDETNARVTALSEAGKKGAQIKQEMREKKPVRTAKPKTIRTSSDPSFEQFWNVYPRQEGEKAARKAWKKATDKPALVDILKAIEIAKKTDQWTKENGQFIPHPSTWINQGRWSDKPLSNGNGAQALHCSICKKDYPDLAAKKTHDSAYHPKFVG